MRFIEVAAVAVTSLLLMSPQPSLAAPKASEPAVSVAQPTKAAPITEPQALPAAAAAVGAAPASPAPIPAITAQQGTALPIARPKPPAPTLVAKVNLAKQTMIVQVGGKTVHTWKVSSGAFGYDTPAGTFKPDWMAKTWYSREYDDAPMPFSVFFKDGAAIHGTTSTGRLGTAASHGCVRLTVANAETFYKLVSHHGLAQTRIMVTGRAPVPDDRIARHDRQKVQPGMWMATQPRAPMRVASRGFTYPGERYAYPAGSVQVRRSPYWSRD